MWIVASLLLEAGFGRAAFRGWVSVQTDVWRCWRLGFQRPSLPSCEGLDIKLRN